MIYDTLKNLLHSLYNFMHDVEFRIVIFKYMIYKESQTKYVNIIGTYRIQNKIVSKSN